MLRVLFQIIINSLFSDAVTWYWQKLAAISLIEEVLHLTINKGSFSHTRQAHWDNHKHLSFLEHNIFRLCYIFWLDLGDHLIIVLWCIVNCHSFLASFPFSCPWCWPLQYSLGLWFLIQSNNSLSTSAFFLHHFIFLLSLSSSWCSLWLFSWW